ncbi:PfkB family carbohydrate kinase [Gracilibacillus sp. YIM 98692]|uniref:carbohydrate kinase family protein n=1 Tax=Gracilibacillus sp. YIM 98692 TaxID=2663532 RepID=UPI0013D327CD|nr:PfkB family carbohydrate kinase [Gracilibacillus sp. YIM 98692]
MNKSIVIAGHTAIDFIPEIKSKTNVHLQSFFTPGSLHHIGSPTFSTGGVVLNTGLALYKMGFSPTLIGKIGNDEFGHILKEKLNHIDQNLSDYMVIDNRNHTSYTTVLNVPGHDRIFLHHPGVNDHFHSEDISEQLLQDHSHFHFGYPPLMEKMHTENGIHLVDIMKKAKNMKLNTSLDMAMPPPELVVDWEKILHNTLPYVDIFMPSIEEILHMLFPDIQTELKEKIENSQEHSEIIHFVNDELLQFVSNKLLRMGCKAVLLKCGELGLYFRSSSNALFAENQQLSNNWLNRELWAPCFKTKVMGTTGAGDCTIAGFLAGMLKEKSIEETMNLSVATGAHSVESMEGTGGIVHLNNIEQRMDNHWEKLMLQNQPSTNSSFQWKDKFQLWTGSKDNITI